MGGLKPAKEHWCFYSLFPPILSPHRDLFIYFLSSNRSQRVANNRATLALSAGSQLPLAPVFGGGLSGHIRRASPGRRHHSQADTSQQALAASPWEQHFAAQAASLRDRGIPEHSSCSLGD